MIPARMMFRFAVACPYRADVGGARGVKWDDACRLPPLASLDSPPPFAEVWAAWSEKGLALAVRVAGKRQPPWCRDSRPEDSDGLRVWIDTRDTHSVHRASRFCHQFMFMPAGTGRGLDEPCAEPVIINRAKENPRPVRPGELHVRREKLADGYRLEAFIPAAALTGWDAQEHPKLGFTYAVIDRELGEQTFSCPAEFPYREDPSLWATLELTRP